MPQTATRRLKGFDTLSFYWRVVVQPYPRAAAALLVLIVCSAIVDMLSVGLTVPLLDVLTGQARAEHGRLVGAIQQGLMSLGMPTGMPAVSFVLVGLVSVFAIARSALALWNQHQVASIAIQLRRKTKTALFDKMLHARYEDMTKRSRGAVIQDVTVPADALAGAMTNLGFLLAGIFNSVLMVGLLCYLSWGATVLIGVLAVAGVQGWRWYADHRATACGRALYDVRGEQTKLQVEAIDGLKVVKAHGLEQALVARQDALSAAERGPELRMVFFRNGPILVNEGIAALVVMGLSAATLFAPGWGIRLSMLAAFLLAMRRIAPAMVSVSQASVALSRYKRELEAIDEVLGRLPQEPRGGAAVERVGEIELADVTLAYASRPAAPALRGVTARLRRGEVTAIVGSTGAGKSTVANILLGLYAPTAGTLQVDGRPLHALDLAAWRRHIGYVCQDVFVFNASIKENIALGDERIPEAEIAWAAGVAQLHDFITALPEGYDTVVGDRGLRLSGGQCQRLAIARAILRRPAVLIFDEATSALDGLTERAVYEAIGSLHQDAIVVVIAHRLSTIRYADQILVLEAGCLVERGAHETLMQQGGLYARLYEEGGRSDAEGTPSPAAVAR